ncbi:MAG: site-specific DNA-methyltransferase, partial [Verrucomicrobiota bacterium]
ELALQIRSLLELQNTFHWIKSITVEPKSGPQVSAGHFKPINSKRFVTDCHEFVFHWTKTGKVELDRLAIGVPYQDKSNIDRWGHTDGKDKRCRGNNWFIPYKTIQSRSGERPHPATFPVELASWCVRLHGKGEATAMLDPFNGIGHSALAAFDCGVAEYTGFEIDEEYLAEAQRRVSERQGALR